MKRKEEILNKAIEFVDKNYMDVGIKTTHEASVAACQEIAEWADENPDEQMIAKYLYEKKGYPIDLNGNLPSFEETMKAVEEYKKYKEDKLIEKACELLARMIWEVTYEDLEGNSVQHYDKMEFIEDFKNYMKGDKL